MPEILLPDLEPDQKKFTTTSGATAEPQSLGTSEQEEEGEDEVKGQEEEDEEDKEGEEEKEDDEEEAVSSALLEPTTLQWPENKERENASMTGGSVSEEVKGEEKKGGAATWVKETAAESVSMESVCTSARGQESRTESERELEKRGRESVEGWMQIEKETGMKEASKPNPLEIEVEDEDGLMNSMPAKAAQVFSPSVKILSSHTPESRGESRPLWTEDTEKTPFLGPHGTPPDGYYSDWPPETQKCGCSSMDRDALKVGVSVFTAALMFPLLVWGGYVFLPFDAPLLVSAPLRVIYTLRCSLFATVPIVLGIFVLGVSRLRFGSVKPLCEGKAEGREVSVHRQYVSDSLSLFMLYFLQLAIMATYLSQELLKLVPLLTIVFAFGRLIYWVSVALGSSVRGVGFGFSFLPTLAMLGANLYFIFMLDAGGSIFAIDDLATPEPPPPPRQRFWG
ncbi:hypothetical protein AAFF_G00427580 [Aldrovandia affinis]|uniref:Transmembrane protein 79 n=1 Tax=Aldrovandia affinis TaxID=143900 RepID=A0AAD7WIX0_9TELE|nr:hypothetical protein AAFF_G00427580 [Aldrovandia affinis]